MVSFTSRLPESTGVVVKWHGRMPSNGKADYRCGGISPTNEREMRKIRKSDLTRIMARQAMSVQPKVDPLSLPEKFHRRLAMGLI